MSDGDAGGGPDTGGGAGPGGDSERERMSRGARRGRRAGAARLHGGHDDRPGRFERLHASRRRALPAALLLGAALTLAQAPVFAWPILFLALPLLARLLFAAPTGARAFHVGWMAGTGFFASGLYWIAEAFFVDIARHGWMAPFAVIGLAAGLGLFWALAFRLAWALRGSGALASLAGLAGAWTLAEMARSYVLTGFPWALQAYAWADVPVSQSLSAVGPHGLSLLTLMLALAPAAPWLAGVRRPGPRMMGFVALSAAAIAGSWAWGAARLEHETPAEGPVIRLVQPNAGQREKWRDDLVAVFFKRLRDLSRPAEGEAAPDLVVWPETAVPWLLEREPELRETIAQAGGGAPVLLGVRRVARDAEGRPGWRNSVAVLDASGEIIAGYDKRHLVPFGEYLPFHDTLAGIGLGAFVGESGGFEPGAGEARLSIPGLPDVAPQVCYETIFPQEMPAAGPDRPQWIVQVTNDAWFGASAGPWQHFHQARMRAIEQGLPLARAANTGISAIIGPYGEVRASLGLLEAGAVQGRLPAALAPTLYARTGDAPAGVAAAILLAVAAAAAWRRGRS